MRIYFGVMFAAFLLIILAPQAQAGISLGKGGITLAAGQTTTMCDVWIYASQEGGTYHVETTGDLKPLTAGITPNDFTLTPIDCPAEANARRACITEKCLSEDQSSCRVVCIEFAAPMLMDINPQKTAYDGSILNSIKIGAATIKEPYTFSVFVDPLDLKPVLAVAAVVVAAIIVALFFLFRRRKKKK